jgi:hypothetical protein
MFDRYFIIGGLGAAMSLFAEGTMPATDIGSYGNLGALGVLSAVLIFIVTKMLPDLQQKFIDQSKIFATAIENQQAKFTEVLDKMHERESDRSDKIATEIAAMRETCAETRCNK